MSEHGADRFDGNTVGEEYRRGCRVAALMESDSCLLYTSACRSASSSISLPAVSIAESRVASVCSGLGLVFPSVMDEPFGVSAVSYTHLYDGET